MESEFKVSAPTSSVEMVLWWSTLAPDEQIPLQVSYSPLSNDYNMLAFLAATDCPDVTPIDDAERPHEIAEPQQMEDLLSAT